VGGVPLAPERRLFPGDEILRGFGRGGMTPLAEASGPGAGPAPAGADSVCGASIEYRVPIRGSLSGSVFADVGWSGLSRRTSGLDPGLHVIPETDRLLRASVGGELRLQLPVLQRPGRLIFSWNPLRLDRLIQSAGSPLRLADPRGAVRFALGDIF
jgi:outer membrane protein assembly factor BamA